MAGKRQSGMLFSYGLDEPRPTQPGPDRAGLDHGRIRTAACPRTSGAWTTAQPPPAGAGAHDPVG
ncbi:hypothetical protein FRAAL6512 [Frankia alni ACN14a]|uniref:Uncharacterized protein n=1 Tax=Frankia alni (strain DSM 45986 / CECT 9034 / ACN14a) TaxID=326424 RepID=Q0RBP9_FRAAA|nr:hypothetical protein FRAAL6512 [Frankia alni ACN14a]